MTAPAVFRPRFTPLDLIAPLFLAHMTLLLSSQGRWDSAALAFAWYVMFMALLRGTYGEAE